MMKKKSPERGEEFKFAGIEMESRLMTEYFLLKKFAVAGVYVVPHYYRDTEIHKDAIWDGVIMVEAGPYRDGKFFFCIKFPDDYPHSWPRVHFYHDIYHPLICFADGKLDMRMLISASKAASDSSTEFLAMKTVTYIKTIFYLEDYWKVVSSYNPEMGERYLKDRKFFLARAKESVEKSLKNPYDVYQNSTIHFEQHHPDHDSILKKVEELSKEEIPSSDKTHTFLKWFFGAFMSGLSSKQLNNGKKEYCSYVTACFPRIHS